MNQYDKLLQRLDLEQIAHAHSATGSGRKPDDVFVGGAGTGGVTQDNRLFGGLVMAQAVVAAARTAQGLWMHAAHAFFLRPGRPDRTIVFSVSSIKTGKRYHARVVTATQGDDTIFHMQAGFTRVHDNDAPGHELPMPVCPPALSLPNRDQARGRDNWEDMGIDVRLCDPLAGTAALAPHKSVWIKPFGDVPDDPVMHLALLVYASDRAFLSTAWRPHAHLGRMNGATLGHSIWGHQPVVFDDWLLFAMASPASAHERGLVRGGLYRQDGKRIASVAQEGTLTFRPH